MLAIAVAAPSARAVPFSAPPRACKPAPALRPVARLSTSCSTCNLHALCLPCGLQGDALASIDGMVYSRKRILRGDAVFSVGDAFKALYVARIGSFKSYMIMADGRHQVTGFQMSGEMVGLDGISTGEHTVNVVALEDSEVCVIPYAQLEELSSRTHGLQHQIHRIMSREIVREQGVMMLLGSMCAEERVATFLLNLSQRFEARGYSAVEFNLRMTREEIGSYLGMTLETVSRILSKFQEQGLISLRLRSIRIADSGGLKRTLSHERQRAAKCPV
jgi:CRP/FNR family transcriptional regulator